MFNNDPMDHTKRDPIVARVIDALDQTVMLAFGDGRDLASDLRQGMTGWDVLTAMSCGRKILLPIAAMRFLEGRYLGIPVLTPLEGYWTSRGSNALYLSRGPDGRYHHEIRARQ